MKYIEENGNIILNDAIDFSVEQTLECGQCFNFEKLDNNDYAVCACGILLHISQDKDKVTFYDTDIITFENVWIPYFDLDRDYGEIKRYLIEKDEVLIPAIEQMYGIHLLNQEFHETLMSFVISQNKQIPHIKQIVRTLSEKFGNYIGTLNDKKYYSFPSVEQLDRISIEDYRECKTGFRAPYLKDASDKLNSGLNKDSFSKYDCASASEELKKIKGVGEKVSNCVMLFSLGYRDAFPVDVWIKRLMEEMYFHKDTSKEEIMRFAKERFGDYGGYAQQYIFYYGRNKSIKN